MKQQKSLVWVLLASVFAVTAGACSSTVIPTPSVPVSSAPTQTSATPSAAHGQAGTVWAWGLNDSGQLGASQAGQVVTNPMNIPDLTEVTQLIPDPGNYGTFVLRSDGSVWGWGDPVSDALSGGGMNLLGQPQPIPGLANIVEIFPGGSADTSVWAVDNSGALWTWGVDSSSRQVTGVKDVKSIYGGLALLGDGSVWRDLCPGCTPSQVEIPGKVKSMTGDMALTEEGEVWMLTPGGPKRVGELTGVKQVLATTTTGFAVMTDGTVWAWTSDIIANSFIPQRVGELTGVEQLFAAGKTVFGVMADGKVWAWPSFSDDTFVPVQVTDAPTITEWGRFAISDDGSVHEVDGTTFTKMAGLSNIRSVEVLTRGGSDSVSAFALDTQGQVWVWGDNGVGQLGVGNSDSSDVPQKLGLTGITSIHASGYSVFALQG